MNNKFLCLFLSLSIFLFLESCKSKKLSFKESQFFTYDDNGVQIKVDKAVFNTRQTIILQVFEIKGFKKDKDGFCHPGMDLMVRNSKDSVVFESKNYIGEDIILELKDNSIPYLFGIWQASPLISPGNYYFDILLYDRIAENTLHIKQAFVIK